MDNSPHPRPPAPPHGSRRLADPDPFHLTRFVDAQTHLYRIALAELEAGKKESHWMWFIFPQLRGLGFSRMASFYGISSRDEAQAYLAHPLLGPRLRECTLTVLSRQDRALATILGSPDDMKLCSCMTLFATVSSDGLLEPSLFRTALEVFCGGKADPRTLALLARRENSR